MTLQLSFLPGAVRTGSGRPSSMRTMVIVVVVPLTPLLVEQMDVVGNAASVQQLVALLVVDAM